MTDRFVHDEVLEAYCKDLSNLSVMPLGCGNINDTYLVQSSHYSFVLQRINSDVFPIPQKVIENFHKVAAHLSTRITEPSNQLQMAVPVLTLDKKLYFRDSEGSFWRGQSYIPQKSLRVLAETSQALGVGKTLATFHRLVRDLEPEILQDPLPGFHNLPRYMEEYDRVVQGKTDDLNDELDFCLAAIERFRPRAAYLEDAKHAGVLKIQPIHGDPKVDNFIFDDKGRVHGLLDLDTVAMGLVHYDLGDCLRSCCNRQGEAEESIQLIRFDMEFCRAFLDGYFSGPEKLLNEKQREYIFEAVLLISFELGLRFFTDHLRGNLYFKVQQHDENLRRAVNQFRLTEDIAAREGDIRSMVLSVGHRSKE